MIIFLKGKFASKKRDCRFQMVLFRFMGTPINWVRKWCWMFEVHFFVRGRQRLRWMCWMPAAPLIWGRLCYWSSFCVKISIGGWSHLQLCLDMNEIFRVGYTSIDDTTSQLLCRYAYSQKTRETQPWYKKELANSLSVRLYRSTTPLSFETPFSAWVDVILFFGPLQIFSKSLRTDSNCGFISDWSFCYLHIQALNRF